MAMLKNSGK